MDGSGDTKAVDIFLNLIFVLFSVKPKGCGEEFHNKLCLTNYIFLC